jgi:hypothetical protein
MAGRYSRKKIIQKKPKRWRIPIILATAGVVALVAAMLLDFDIGGRPVDFTPDVIGAPAISVDNERINYGDVKLGTTLKTDFRVTNIGSEDLKFTSRPYVEVKEGC